MGRPLERVGAACLWEDSVEEKVNNALQQERTDLDHLKVDMCTCRAAMAQLFEQI